MFDERATATHFVSSAIEFTRRKFTARYAVSEEELRFLNRAVLSQHTDMMARTLIYSIAVDVLARPREERSFAYPATWWDAFKLRWFPRWLRLRVPVEMTVVRFAEVYDLYPSLDIPGHRPVLYIPEPVRQSVFLDPYVD